MSFPTASDKHLDPGTECEIANAHLEMQEQSCIISCNAASPFEQLPVSQDRTAGPGRQVMEVDVRGLWSFVYKSTDDSLSSYFQFLLSFN